MISLTTRRNQISATDKVHVPAQSLSAFALAA